MKNTHSFTLFAALSLSAALLGLAATDPTPPRPAAAWTLGTGFDYSRGDYGFATDTEVFSVPLNLSCDTGRWLLSASMPWLTIKGPAGAVGTGGAPRPTVNSESGLGDAVVGATYRFNDPQAAGNIAFSGRVKFPTADEERGLGTGSTDFYGQFDFYRTIGNFTPFASVGYRLFGHSPVYQLEDGAYAEAGTHYRLTNQTVATFSGSWGEKIVRHGEASTEVTVALTHDVDEQWRLSGYVLKGLTDASPDFGGGLQIGYRF